ncbi:MAG: EF-hand domain-containing protein [Sphingomicrobium sp.]
MRRFLAGAAACLLLVTGAFMLWQSRAEGPALPSAPLARFAAATPPGMRLAPIPNAPEADARSKEEKRFARADKNKDGRITLAELVEPRRKAYDRLDLDHDGKLSFEEWSVKTIDKFKEADADKSQVLNAVEYAATAPKPKAKKPGCGCG